MKAPVRLAFAAAIALAMGSTAFAQTTTPLRVTAAMTDTSGELFYAIDKGFFKQAGLDVELTVANPAGVSAAVASGTYDIGHTPVPAVASAREHGLPFVIIAPSSVFNVKLRPTAGIVVAKNSPIKTPKNFNDKTVAVSALQSIAQVSVEAWVDKNGGDSSTVKFIEMPFSAMIPALESGRVDAIELAEPLLDEAEAAGQRSLSSGYEAIANEFAIGAYFCTTAFATAHPDVVRKFANVMAQTARWANTHQAESGEILAKWSKEAVPATMPRVIYGERATPALFQPIIDVSAKYKALRAPFPAADLIAPGL
jgi:NitT/TauT family transport system substrate-binding protein